jgi:hypothetical protein
MWARWVLMRPIIKNPHYLEEAKSMNCYVSCHQAFGAVKGAYCTRCCCGNDRKACGARIRRFVRQQHRDDLQLTGQTSEYKLR